MTENLGEPSPTGSIPHSYTVSLAPPVRPFFPSRTLSPSAVAAKPMAMSVWKITGRYCSSILVLGIVEIKI